MKVSSRVHTDIKITNNTKRNRIGILTLFLWIKFPKNLKLFMVF